MRASMRTGVKHFAAERNWAASGRDIVKVVQAQVYTSGAWWKMAVYKEALESGELSAERSGVWYDLLPADGMTPVLDSVKLRSG